MGKHRKPKPEARHARAKENATLKKVAKYSVTAATVPTAAFVFSTTASAATMSQWNGVSIPEAGGDWCIDHSGDGLSVGGLQFQNPSWHDALSYLNSHGHNTSQWKQNLTQGMGRANVPSKDQQVLAGEALLAIQGPGAWANGNAGGVGASMFQGGANPWGLAGSNAPAGIELPASCTGSTPVPPVNPPPVTPPINPPPVNPPGENHHWGHHRHHWKHQGHSWKPRPVVPPVVPPVPVVPVVTPTDPAPAVAPASCDHIVVSGDTVSQVAATVGAPLADVEAVNPSIAAHQADYGLIFAGGHIHMPAGFCDGNQ